LQLETELKKCSKMVWRPGDPALPRPLTGFKRGEGAREGRGYTGYKWMGWMTTSARTLSVVDLDCASNETLLQLINTV